MTKLYTILITLFPILSVYATYINNLSIADLLLILIILIILFKKLTSRKSKLIINSKVILLGTFLLYLMISLLIQIMLGSKVEILSTIRYLIYIVALILSIEFFDVNLSLKILKKITILVSLYTIIQFVFFKFIGVTLPWRIPGLRIMDEAFILKETSEYYLTFYRPTGIFLEPTHLVQYIYVYLIYCLFNLENKIYLRDSIIISTAIVCSGSSLGVFVLILTFCIWVILNIINKKIKIKNILGILISLFILMIITPLLIKIPYFGKIFSRVITENGLTGAAVGYRFDSLSLLFDENIPIIFRFIGYGRGTNTQYMTAIPYIIYCNGIIGFIIYMGIMCNLILKTKSFPKILAIVVFITSIGSEIIINFGILFYLVFIINKYECNNVNLEGEIQNDRVYKTI